MSDRLVIEFYDSGVSIPAAAVLVWYGGDNPADAALTISDFLQLISGLASPRFDSAGLLAARFIVWHGSHVERTGLNISDIILITPAAVYQYQLARIYASPDGPRVEIVPDDYSTPGELKAAFEILTRFKVSH